MHHKYVWFCHAGHLSWLQNCWWETRQNCSGLTGCTTVYNGQAIGSVSITSFKPWRAAIFLLHGSFYSINSDNCGFLIFLYMLSCQRAQSWLLTVERDIPTDGQNKLFATYDELAENASKLSKDYERLTQPDNSTRDLVKAMWVTLDGGNYPVCGKHQDL